MRLKPSGYEVVSASVPTCAMPLAALTVARRAFVSVLLELASIYGLVLPSTRGSASDILEADFKRVARKAHPDKIPPASPDFNPVEKVWAWVRKQIVRMDLKDLRDGKPAVSKMGLKLRLQRLVRTRKAQNVAGSIALGLRKVCREVSMNGGGPSRS